MIKDIYLSISAQGVSFNSGRVTCASLIELVLYSVKPINTPIGVCVGVHVYALELPLINDGSLNKNGGRYTA